jgi:hypothetical protein
MMKNLYYYWNKAVFTTVTLALATALAVGFSACDKEKKEDNLSSSSNDVNGGGGGGGDNNGGNNNGDLYSPPKDMTNDDIRALLEEVDANMATVRAVSVEATFTEKENGGPSYTFKGTGQIYLDNQKELTVGYDSDGKTIGNFTYAENSTKYEYMSASYIDNEAGIEIKRSYKLSDIYWNNSSDISMLELEWVFELEWEVSNQTFVGSFAKNGATMKMTITLTSDKRIASFKTEEIYPEGSYVTEARYTYSANPTWPSGFAKEDFPLVATQYLTVVWGEGFSESRIYTDPGDYYINFESDILDHAPTLEGKTPVLYKDEAREQPVNSQSSILVKEDNTTILYVEWVPASASKSKASSAAKPLSKKLNASPEKGKRESRKLFPF